MKNSELIKLLKKNKCYFVKHGSNHDIWFSPITNKQFPIPRHKDEIANGTIKAICKEAGIN